MEIVTSGAVAMERGESSLEGSRIAVKTEPMSPDRVAEESHSRKSPPNDHASSENDEESGSDDSATSSSSEDSGSESDSDSDKPDDGISAYERLRIERIRRNEERLKQLGLVDPSKRIQQPKKQRASFGATRKKRIKEIVPKRSQPKRTAKVKLDHSELFSDGQIDLRRSWPLRKTYKDRMYPQKHPKMPKKVEYSKRYNCGECRACKRDTDCNTCYFCAINERQSSSSTVRRRCLFRMCLHRLVDVEVDVEPENEEKVNEKVEEKPPSDENNAEDATDVDKSIDKDSDNDGVRNDVGVKDSDDEKATVTEGKVVKTENLTDESPNETSTPKDNTSNEPPASNPDCNEEKGEDEKEKEIVNEKVPIENSEYFASYRMEEDESGLPKWLDEFFTFMATIPHGPMNRTSGQRNAENTMSQVCKLVSGEGVTYHLWPEGTYFKRGIKIHLGMDLSTLLQEAIAMERRYEDRRKGSLLRHPIAKIICYKEWIADGKPAAPKEPPTSPLLTLPPPTTNNVDKNRTESNKANLGKRIVAMTIEQRIKPNRVRWASDTTQVRPLAANEDDKTTNQILENTNDGNSEKMSVNNDDENVATIRNLENASGMNYREGTKRLDANRESYTSQGDDKENKRESIGLCDDKDINSKKVSDPPSATTTSETNRQDRSSAKTLNNESTDGASENIKTDINNIMPNSCSICSGDGDLICCDGCNRGFHSNCHFPKIKEIPLGEWYCKDCTRKRKPQKPRRSYSGKRELVVNQKLFEGEHGDDCYMCRFGGDLICCDFCPKAFHLNCHIPPLPFVPEGIWKCFECLAAEGKRMSRCGECEACTRDDCGECKFCLDKIKFGGLGTLRQVCVKKACPYQRYTPRKRGRPRKYAVYGDPSISGTFVRKRGRPRKSVNGDSLAMNLMHTAAPLKRKRGRPRKSLDGASPAIDGSGTEPPAKKKRGRPRKVVEVDPFIETSEVATPTKRKRGRPRKSIIVDGLKLETDPDGTITSRRGRSEKSENGENLPIESTRIATPTKKKRGRPKKSLSMGETEESKRPNDDAKNEAPKEPPVVFRFKISSFSPIKKKRGRPKKSQSMGETKESKRPNNDAENEAPIEPPVVFRFKISSFKSVYKDPESTKIRRVIKTAIRDPTDSKTVDKACENLRKCMKSPENVKTAMLFGGVEMLCRAMRDHPDKNILQAEACCTLAEMIWVFPGVSKKLVHMGVIDLIVTSIHGCPNNSKVQQMGCGALGAFSYDENYTQRIIDAGGVKAVLAAIERFPKRVAVLMEGCYFFQNMIVRSVDALRMVSNSQVVPIIVESMMSTENLNRDTLLPMCGLIANLAVNEDGKKLIGQSDAISAAISVLNSSNDAEVKQAACTVLKNLAVGSSANQQKIAEQEGLDAVLDVIRAHPSDAILQMLAFNVMKELCVEDEEIAYQIVEGGGIKFILKAMQKNVILASLQIAACELIGYLPIEGKSEIHAPRLVKAIVTAMKHHSDESDVQIQGCDALFELAQISTTRLILKRKETKELLLRAKRQFKSCASDVDDIIASSNK